MSFELTVALRYMKTRRQGLFALVTTIIAVAGVCLGVAALNVTLAVMNGFHTDIQNKILGIQSHMVTLLQGVPVTEQDAVRDKILATPGVKAAAPFLYGQILMRHGEKVSGAVLKGIDPVQESALSDITRYMKEGSWSEFENPAKKNILVGRELALNLGLNVGDSVVVVPPLGAASPMGLLPKLDSFEVAGIFECGYYEYDNSLVYVKLPHAQALLGSPKGITGFAVMLKSLDNMDASSQALKQTLGPKAWVRTWQDLNRPLFSALKLEKIVMFLILILIVLVAASNIVSNLLLITMEKTRDIGILKALGSSRRNIRRIFIWEGTLIGSLGVSIGTILGVAISIVLDKTHWIALPADVYYLTSLPIQLEWTDVVTIAASAMAITVIATIYPAAKAARIEPMSSIRSL